MRKKEFYTTILVVILGVIIIYLFTLLDMQLKESAQMVDRGKYNIYRTLEALILIFFGVLIEYKKIISAFKNKISINKYYLITGIGLVVLLILPYRFIPGLLIRISGSIKWTIIWIFNSISTRSILSVLAGILLARSLSIAESAEVEHIKEKN